MSSLLIISFFKIVYHSIQWEKQYFSKTINCGTAKKCIILGIDDTVVVVFLGMILKYYCC